MSEQFNNKPKFSERLKNLKVNKSALVAICVLVVSVIILTAVAVATNRAKKDVTDDTPKPPTTQNNNNDTQKPTPTPDTQQPEDSTPSTTPNTPSTPVEDKLPSFVLPVSGSLTSKHDPTLQVYSNTMNDYRVHIGIDLNTEASAPVYAAADGKVDRIWEDTLMGYCIAIKHSGNCYTIYKNLANTLPDGIAEGVSVRSGQLIASVGESAMVEIAQEPHLHFEMTVADLCVDPLEYFDEKALASLGIDASYGE